MTRRNEPHCVHCDTDWEECGDFPAHDVRFYWGDRADIWFECPDCETLYVAETKTVLIDRED